MTNPEARQIAEQVKQKEEAGQYIPHPVPEFKTAKEVVERLLRIEMGGPSGLTLPALRLLATEHLALEARCAALEESKDEAYSERNKLVRLLASLYPSGLKATSIEGWDPDWHWCVYIDLPTGQASWHIHVSEYPNFSHLPNYEGEWDGHTTEEKYRRIAALTDNGGQADG